MKETISLKEFASEAAKFSKELKKLLKPAYNTYMKCPECNNTYDVDTNFCKNDGKKLIKEKYEIYPEGYRDAICGMFYDLSNGVDLGDTFPYKFVEQFETYDDDHDGDAYFVNFIFQRKSDGKHFEFTITDRGELDGDNLYEVEQVKVTKTKWQ